MVHFIDALGDQEGDGLQGEGHGGGALRRNISEVGESQIAARNLQNFQTFLVAY